jgi:hypothetical protein
MYFETGQGSALSADAHFGVDQQTCEVRAHAVARAFKPMLVNTVVGFIGPEYLYDAKQIIRAGLEDHFCGKLLGLPMGVDVCYTNHAEADQTHDTCTSRLLGSILIWWPGGRRNGAIQVVHTLGCATAKPETARIPACWTQDVDGNPGLLPPGSRPMPADGPETFAMTLTSRPRFPRPRRMVGPARAPPAA